MPNLLCNRVYFHAMYNRCDMRKCNFLLCLCRCVGSHPFLRHTHPCLKRKDKWKLVVSYLYWVINFGISIGIFNNMNFFKRGKSIKMKTKWRLKICLGIPIKYFAWKPLFCTESSDLNLIWSELEVEVIKFGSIFPQNLPNGLLDPSPFVTST